MWAARLGRRAAPQPLAAWIWPARICILATAVCPSATLPFHSTANLVRIADACSYNTSTFYSIIFAKFGAFSNICRRRTSENIARCAIDVHWQHCHIVQMCTVPVRVGSIWHSCRTTFLYTVYSYVSIDFLIFTNSQFSDEHTYEYEWVRMSLNASWQPCAFLYMYYLPCTHKYYTVQWNLDYEYICTRTFPPAFQKIDSTPQTCSFKEFLASDFFSFG